ncbi:Hypothetical protein SCLAV_p0383 (plasmid) [Streptomyces clavuligerus]|uniref:Uncharacterized protein n=1 Tax=Streptomyces clavuligerus TaxID=1901 RepID=D5SIY0_STRCL|nr:Hypothetical protein SCLAV_p0383 [Streptomyces clavuligerus]
MPGSTSPTATPSSAHHRRNGSRTDGYRACSAY